MPLLVWQTRLHLAVPQECKRYQAIAHWAKSDVTHPAAGKLEALAGEIRPHSSLSIIIVGCCLGVAALFATALAGSGGGLQMVLDSTYFFEGVNRLNYWSANPDASLHRMLFIGWSLGLSAAYFCHWLQVQLHARQVRRFLTAFNTLAIHDGLAPIFLPPVGIGLRPLWLLGMAPLIYFNAFWGIPMMLAGAVQRRYARGSANWARAALSTRLQQILAIRQSARRLPAPVLRSGHLPIWRRCPTPVCLQVLPPEARFCPRCGVRAMPAFDQRA
jgi:hypothetical protein